MVPSGTSSDPVSAVSAFEALADRVGVELVAWPLDERRRQLLARAGVPRLLLVAEDAPVPDHVGLDEGWIRLPCDRDDVVERLDRLGRSLDWLGRERPVVDRRHVVHHGGASVALSPAQAAVVRLLLDRRGAVVPREVLETVVWPDGAPGPKALDGVVFRLRRRLAGLGLVVRNAHGRGFVIDAHEPGAEHPTAV